MPDVNLLSMNKPKTLVIGDLCIDIDYCGHPRKLDQTAAVPIMDCDDPKISYGCAGNLTRQLLGFGHSVVNLTLRPTAYSNQTYVDRIVWRGYDAQPHAEEIAQRAYDVKTRIYDQCGRLLLRFDQCACAELTPSQMISELCEQLVELSSFEFDYVVFANYGRMDVSQDWSTVLATVRKTFPSAVVVVEPHDRTQTKMQGADLIKLNGRDWHHGSDYRDGDRREVSQIVVTNANKPVIKIDADGEISVPVPQKAVIDPTGAGDTFLASLLTWSWIHHNRKFCSFRHRFQTSREDISHAAAAATTSAMHVGTSTVDCLASFRLGPREVSLSAAAYWSYAYQQQSVTNTVGMANGCFDLFHAGHRQMLKAASQMCGLLVVCVNDDTSVAAVKGDQRPVMSLDQRLSAIRNGLADCHNVLICSFSGITARHCLQELRPTYLFKGESSRGRVCEADIATSCGTQLSYIGEAYPISTSKILELAE